jgi:hypothetical protein
MGCRALGHDPLDAADFLRAHGVPAAPCRDCRTITDHPSYVGRALFEPISHPLL